MIISDLYYCNHCVESDSIIFDWRNTETEETGQFIAELLDKKTYENLDGYSYQDISDYLS